MKEEQEDCEWHDVSWAAIKSMKYLAEFRRVLFERSIVAHPTAMHFNLVNPRNFVESAFQYLKANRTTPFKVRNDIYFNLVNSRHFSVDKNNQLDVTFCILYFSSNSCSRCFGQPCAHYQELTTAWCYSLVLVCAVAAGRLSRLLYYLFLF